MLEPAVSVIIPVHNASLYLGESIDSVLGQTLSNIELICVDDGSTDDSLQILYDYQLRDPRVRIIEASGRGAAAARNEGFAQAQGEYVLFLDADDFFRPDMLELAVCKAVNNKADIVIFGGHFFDDEKKSYVTEEACLQTDLLPQSQTFSKKDVPSTLFQIINPAPWTKLIRRAFIEDEGVRFQSLPNSNDLFFSYACISQAKTIGVVKESLVSYRVQTRSSTQDKKAKDPCCFISACEALGSFLDERGTFNLLRNTYDKVVVSNAAYNYRTVEDSTAREKILNNLFSEDHPHVRNAFLRPIDDKRFEQYRTTILSNRRKLDRAHISSEIADSECEGSMFSIIVPVHNCEQTLERAINSVLSQSFGNFEVVIVDDASADGSLRVAQVLASRDDRVTVLSLPTNVKGLRARQVGVEKSSGQYVMFLDGDDEYAPGLLEFVAEQMKEEPVDILHFPLEKVSLIDGSPVGDNAFFQPYLGIITGSDNILAACFSKGLMNWNLVNKVFRGSVCRAAFKNLEAEKIHRGDDLVAFTFLGYYSESYRGVGGSPLYLYYFGAGQDGDKPITLSEFKELCTSVKASRLIARKLNDWHEPAEVVRGFEGVERRLLDNCVQKFKKYLPGNKKTEGLDILFSLWGYQKSIVALMYQYWTQSAKFSRMVAGTQLVSDPRRSIRSIAAYYRTCEGGGVENVLRQLTELWLRQGYKVTWFLEVEPKKPELVPDTVDVVIIPSVEGGSATGYQARFKKILDAIDKYSIDVVVYHQWLSSVLLWDMLAVKIKHASLVIHCHGLFTNQMRFGLYNFSSMPEVYSLADGIVAINPTDKLFWSYFNKSVYQTNNILEDSSGYESSGLKNGKQVLWLGRLSPEKHPEKAIEIAQQLKNLDSSITLIIAGSATTDEYEQKLFNMAIDAGVADTVKFVGWCDGQKKKDLFALSAVFLMTSEAREGFPLTLLESKAAGIPVVMFDLPYLTVLQDPQGILTVPQGDVSAAAWTIYNLLNNTEQYQQECLEAKASAQEYLSYDQASFWKEVFSEVPTNLHATDNNEVRILWDALLESYPLAIDRWKQENDRLKADNRKLKKRAEKAEAIKESRTWYIGRVVTYLPRTVKKAFKKLRAALK